MTKQEKKLSEKIKAYHILLLSIMLCPLIMINSNHAVEKRKEAKLYAEASEKFERILIGRKLESFEEGTKKICDSGSDKLKEYYRTGDKSKIGLKDDDDDEDEKTPAHVDALLDILKGAVGEESKNSMEDNAMTYGKHVLGSIVFLVIAFLSLIGWVVCCSCCCCNCYCCCCCTQPKCRLPFFIITMACYALVIAVSIYGLAESNIIFVGISDTECSFLKFFNETIEGESKVEKPKWAGVAGINSILDLVKGNISEKGTDTLNALDTEESNIKDKQRIFEELLETNSKAVSNEENNKENFGTESPKYYRLDITSKDLYGIYIKNDNRVEQVNSFIYAWHQEYSGFAGQSTERISEAKTNFDTVLKGQLKDQIQDIQKQVDDIGTTIDDIKESISGMIIDYSDLINDYGKLGFKIVFSVLAIIDAAIAAFVFLLCFFSGKLCNKCCCCRCAFKFVIHLLWNIFALLMFLSFLIGSIFTIIGSLGKDAISVINYLVSNKNLNAENPLIIGEEGKKIGACFNGNGDILTELGFDVNDMNALDQLYALYDQIGQIEQSFRDLEESDRLTYYIMKGELEKRVSYETLEFYAISNDDDSDKLFLSRLVDDLNGEGTGKYSFNCNDGDSTCKDLNDDVNIPLNSDNGKKIQKIKRLVEKADKNPDSTANSFKELTDNLFTQYKIFLNAEISALEVFKAKILIFTGIFEPYVGRTGKVSDFVNCLFIGRNLRVILKNLHDSLGSNLYTVGICLILSGCSIAISIAFTILLIVIINKSVDANKA